MSLGKRVDRPSRKQPEATGMGKLGVGKKDPRVDITLKIP
jgi:hypothetical protein